jgi:hypothetical protein
MNNDKQNKLDQRRRELERLVNANGRGRSIDNGPHAAELEYYLSQLSNVVTTFHHLAYRSMNRYDPRPELLAHVDSVLKYTGEITELAERVREVLLRPPPEDREPGFTE